MKKFIISSYLLLLLSGLSGCADQYGNTNYQGAATVGGVAAGALIGGKLAGSSTGSMLVGGLIGAAAGGFLGNEVGKRLDSRSREKMNQTAIYTLNSGVVGRDYSWQGDNANGSFMVTKDYQYQNRYCREFTQKIYIGGKEQTGYGRACRQPDGNWEIVN